MSPSSIEVVGAHGGSPGVWRRVRAAARGLSRSSACLGVALDRESIAFVMGRWGRGGWRVDWSRHLSLETPLFAAEPGDAECRGLADAIASIRPLLGSAYLPVQVALPDPLVHVASYHLEALPPSAQARDAFFRWRVARDLHLDAPSLAVTTQVLNRDETGALLLGLAVARPWLTCIQSVFSVAGLLLGVVDSAASYGFNDGLSRGIVRAGEGAALVRVGSDSWTLLMWDRQERLRYVRGRWHARREIAHAVDDVARELGQILRAYVATEPDAALDRLYLAGMDEYVQPLGAIVGQRLGSDYAIVPASAGRRLDTPLEEVAAAAAQCR